MHAITHTNQENEYLAKPLIHKTNVHRRKWSLLVGVGFFLYGFGCLTRGAMCPLPISIACFALEIIVFIFMFIWLAIPCECGKIPLFTATARLKIMKQKNKSYEAIQYIIAASVVSILVAIPLLLHLAVQGFSLQAAQMCHGGVIAALGCAIVIAGSLNKLPRSLPVIPEKEYKEIAALNRETEKGLNRLIAFHLKAGNFVEADACSRKLLEIAERDSVVSTET